MIIDKQTTLKLINDVYHKVYTYISEHKFKLFAIITISLIFLWDIFAGKNSIWQWNKLQQQETVYYQRIVTLKNNNANLKKKYYEYKNLEE